MGNHDGAENQAANQLPPRRSHIMAMTLDTTARYKALGLVSLAGMASPALITDNGKSCYLTLIADVDWYFCTADGAAVVTDVTTWLDPAAADINTVSTPTKPANACVKVFAGAEVNIRVDRWTDYYLIVKAVSTGGILRAFASSDVWQN